jgi:hypothetical protein
MATKKATETTTWDAIDIGDQVKHAKWGVGTVLFRSGTGETAKAIVAFPEEGQKKLMLKYAGLVKVGSTSLKSVEKLRAETDGSAKKKATAKPKAAPKPKAKAKAAAPDDDDDDDIEIDLDLEDDDEVDLEDDGDVAGFDDDDEFTPAKKKDDADI